MKVEIWFTKAGDGICFYCSKHNFWNIDLLIASRNIGGIATGTKQGGDVDDGQNNDDNCDDNDDDKPPQHQGIWW